MKNDVKLTADFEPEYDAQEIFIDVCKAAVALTLIGMVLYTII